MLIEPTTLLWAGLVVDGVLGAIATPILIYVLGQNADRKKESATQAAEQRKELATAFESIRQQRDVDQKHIADVLGEIRDKNTALKTTVDLKKETVDRVSEQQNLVGVRVAVVEQSIRTITDSQARSEQNWQKVSEQLNSLGRIEEKVENLVEDMREVRAEQNRKSE